MSVWYCVPSKRPAAEAEKCLARWRGMGYRIALWRDDDAEFAPGDWVHRGPYPGYATAVNHLVQFILKSYPDPGYRDWVVTGGDDVYPDPTHTAQEIAESCSRECWILSARGMRPHSTFGVMQPTGDKWGDKNGPYIERVAGSPWMGREWCERINQGRGPLWPEYFHMGEDEELQHVAIKHGVFWQRPDLIHYHDHWGRAREGERLGQRDRMPQFLEKANSPEEWHKYKKLFSERLAAGFPGSDPL